MNEIFLCRAGFGGGAGQRVYEGAVPSRRQEAEKCKRIYSVPYSSQLYLLGPFIPWEEVCVTAGGLPYLCLSVTRSSSTKSKSGKQKSATMRRVLVSGVSMNTGH